MSGKNQIEKGKNMTVSKVKQSVVTLLVLGLIMISSMVNAGDKKVILGIVCNDADKYKVEFEHYGDRISSLYRKYNIAPTFLESRPFMGREEWSEDKMVEMLKSCEVVDFVCPNEGISHLDDKLKARAKIAGQALAKYVKEGGGLFLQCEPTRYPGHDDIEYWNIVLEPLGVKILHEGVYDKKRALKGPERKHDYWFTDKLKKHQVTEGLGRLYLPKYGFNKFPGIPALEYGSGWEVIVSGEPEAKSYKTGVKGAPTHLNDTIEGTYKSAPPVVAVRQFGKGRIVSFPLTRLYAGVNYGLVIWDNVVERDGDLSARIPSHTLDLVMKAYQWLAEPAQADPKIGTYQPKPYKRVAFPKTTVDWDKFDWNIPEDGGVKGFAYKDGQSISFTKPSPGVKGIIGAHTSYTDGKGTVADYVKAAKAAGLSFIVFNDPLEMLDAKELEQLKKDCKQASDGSFYACPGIEFTDDNDNRWAMWGHKVVFPPSDFTRNQKEHYKLWDGKRLLKFGKYSILCTFSPVALIDYKKFREKGHHPENMWWYWQVFPLAYDRDKLIADNVHEWLFSLRDMRWNAPYSFTRIKTPKDVALAANTFETRVHDVASAENLLNKGPSFWKCPKAQLYTTQGPEITFWHSVNRQMEYNWRYTRGAQRVRLKFIVKSPAGIKEVKVHDADRGLIRRFAGENAKQLEREFELVHDQQHYLCLEVVGADDKRAFSHCLLVFCYKQGLFRCGDNLNILGATGLLLHPDRLHMLEQQKVFRNAWNYSIKGYDQGAPICPMPKVYAGETVSTKEFGSYPNRYKDKVVTGKVLDMGLSSYNIQIMNMTMDKEATQGKGVGAIGAIARDIGELKCFKRKHTLYAPADRIDNYVRWNYRRFHESMSNYTGGIFWHEGEIEFTKDVTLKGDVPIPLVDIRCPVNLKRSWGNVLLVTDRDAGTKVEILTSTDKKKHIRFKGYLKPGGYLAQMPLPMGYSAFLAPQGSNFTYKCYLPGRQVVGLGKNGQQVKAGTKIKYRYAIGTFPDEKKAGNEWIEDTIKGFNIDGGKAGYPVTVKTGTYTDGMFFFTIKADDHEAVFTLGPRKLLIDLPIRVKGVQNNGCVALFSSVRPLFRFVSVVGDTAVFQEPITRKNKMWVGNIFATDSNELKVSVVPDPQLKGTGSKIEVNNPTYKAIKSRLYSPKNTPVFGGMETSIDVPPGESVWLKVGADKKLQIVK